MKKLITASCALLVTAGSAFGAAFVWDGSSTTTWTTPSNWDLNSSYPGDPFGGSNNDTATIDKSLSATNFPVLSQDETIASLDMFDGTSMSPVSLEVASTRTLTITGDLTVGDSSAGSGAESYVEYKGAGAVSVQGSVIFQAPTNNPTTIVYSGTGSLSTN